MIEQGKLAVVIGVESSDPSRLLGAGADCTRADVDRGLARMRRLGVRSLFVAHWVDNAFAGAALEGGIKGTFINVFNQVETGHYFNTGPCPDPSQGEELDTLGPFEMQILGQFFPATAGIPPMPDYRRTAGSATRKGLTKLGAYLIRRMIADADADRGRPHERDGARAGAADRRRPAAIRWSPATPAPAGRGRRRSSKRLYAHGGLATATPDPAPELAAARCSRSAAYRSPRRYFGVGLGTDTGGFSSLPGPRADAAADPLALPVQVLRRRGRVHPPAHRRARLRPEHRRRRPLRPVRRPDRARCSAAPTGRPRCGRCFAPPRPICRCGNWLSADERRDAGRVRARRARALSPLRRPRSPGSRPGARGRSEPPSRPRRPRSRSA